MQPWYWHSPRSGHKIVAQGVSPGSGEIKRLSPIGTIEFSPMLFSRAYFSKGCTVFTPQS